MDPTRWLDACVTWALELGPDGRFVLPVLGASVGLVGFVVVWGLLSQRTAWRLRELLAALRTVMHAEEEGERVVLVGRLRAPGGETIASFEREDRRAVVSSIHQRVGRVLDHVATRATEGLVLETRGGPVPIAGFIDVRRTRATKKAKNVDARSLARATDARELHAVDVSDGQWVLAEGIVTRVTREGLREQAGVRGLAGVERAPVVLTALRPEVPPWTFRIGAIGALTACLLATPLPWPWTPSLVEVTNRAAWDVLTTARLLGPTREAALESFVESHHDPRIREWHALASLERGQCDVAVALFAALRRDEDALALLDRPGCTIDPTIELQLVRESGYPQRAWRASARVAMSELQREMIRAEAGEDVRPPASRDWMSTASAITCEHPCREAIAGQGERAYELVQSLQSARAEPLSACRGEALLFLAELGLQCGRFTPEEGVEALRLAPRPRVIEPLSRVEARLHVHRLLLESASELEEARAVEARQRRILAILSTPGGVRAEALWALPPQPTRPACVGFECSPLYDPESLFDMEGTGASSPPAAVYVDPEATPEERVEALLRGAAPSAED